jgi:hypothetical protein
MPSTIATGGGVVPITCDRIWGDVKGITEFIVTNLFETLFGAHSLLPFVVHGVDRHF